jgi:hypothetical protein
LQDLLNHIEKTIFTQALSIRQGELQPRDKVLWLLSVDKDIGGQAISTDRGVSLGLLRGGIIGSPDEGDDEALDSLEKLETVVSNMTPRPDIISFNIHPPPHPPGSAAWQLHGRWSHWHFSRRYEPSSCYGLDNRSELSK